MLKMAKCDFCNELHPINDIEPTYRKPDAVVKAMRRYGPSVIAKGDNDLIILEAPDSRGLFVRCTIPLPIVDTTNVYSIGTWVEVTRHDFAVILDNWTNPNADKLPAIHGWIANEILQHKGSLNEEVTLTLHEKTCPTVTVTNEAFSLYKEQKEGIKIDRILQYQKAMGVTVVEQHLH